MDFENVIKIFDSCWFEMEILKSQPSLSVFEANPDQENEEKQSKPEISRIPSRHMRSMSADLTSFDSVLSLSPDSVLFAPKLQTILSGKESIEGEEEEAAEPKPAHDFQEQVFEKKAAARTRRRKRNTCGGGESKSLSDLEFEELKGFMDLGFVFTEEDNKDSRLVEIVPALQRLKGRDQISDDHINDDHDHESANNISRPYLSEAWDVLDMKKEEEDKSPLLIMNWKIPALSNEIDMKDHLKWWAHTVASNVR
ncbi:hypothetical protein Ddye_024271 [Dipteronia dyeriana]|uniref:Uncharacterized protein n=1 Tax=Dipteronia dyeriana TaxID=168575 RepID=A0AAD9TV73_9ROSI|nr:hypothetical protein Ddye_024271 [Dipteronia dyeriana]